MTVNKNYSVVICARKGVLDIDWKEVFNSVDLLYFLTWRDIKVRYKQTVLGILWIIIQPLVSMVIFTIIFGNLANIPSDNLPYPIFVFIGLMFWNFFSAALTSSSNSLISNENIIKKVYFPRILFPLSSTLAHIVDLVPVLIIFIVLIFYYKAYFNPLTLLLLPLSILILLTISIGVGMFLAPINAKFRDIRHVLPYFIQLGFFASPIIYSTSILGRYSDVVKAINPVAVVIEATRSTFVKSAPIDWKAIISSMVISIIVFTIGFYYFRKQEDKFIDIL